MAGENQGAPKPKGEVTVTQAARQDIESIEKERLAQEAVRQTGREGEVPATGVVADKPERGQDPR